jgi:hypothetical protein
MVGFQYALMPPFPTQRLLTSGRLLGFGGGTPKTPTRSIETSLDEAEFIRGFLLHLLPSGFVKIPGNGESLSRSCYTRGPRLPTSSNLMRRCARPVGRTSSL